MHNFPHKAVSFRKTIFAFCSGEMQRRSLEAFYDSDVQKEEIKDLLDQGLQMIEKLKCWYSRKSSQCYYTTQVYMKDFFA